MQSTRGARHTHGCAVRGSTRDRLHFSREVQVAQDFGKNEDPVFVTGRRDSERAEGQASGHALHWSPHKHDIGRALSMHAGGEDKSRALPPV
eukprot:CAMPEP_0115878316 /NCGR_PEP_ID=MMETSP0287-20121206/26707_1 /TAXON_ID=412157 /ORGANISM="Chrysochromulina rotalis, Strain UIO044" /LENGTH=91 /DNA_ID=CAMNT_0003333921 /DNA_START=318 /DNA_END=593 /DNA_ORIENTATION=-